MKLFAMLGAINMALGVILGAFGAHSLKSILAVEQLTIYHIAVQYQIYHALGLLLVAALQIPFPRSGGLRTGGWLLVAGIILFSGSLYIMALTGWSWLGPVTPVGGACFIIGWLWIFWAMLSER